MINFFFLLIFFSAGYAQNPFFDDPVVSGTALVPDEKIVEEYINKLRQTDKDLFNKYTQSKELPLNVGDEYNFKVLSFKSDQTKSDLKTFVLKKSEALINIWVEDAELENLHVTDQVIEKIYTSLIHTTLAQSINPDQGIFELERNFFGDPPDVDGNGKVEFLLTDIQDNWDEEGSYVGGFFYSADQTGSVAGNNADILYVDTYPGIYSENNGQPVYNESRVLGTVAHELQHLIHYAYDRDEEIWINEGLSELASFICGYGLRSPDLYLKNTSISLTDWDNEDALEHYSRAALWTFFLYEKFGADFIRRVVLNSANGVTGVNYALDLQGLSFNETAEIFFKTLLLNNPQINSDYAFRWEALHYLTAKPRDRVTDYPFITSFNARAYSVNAFLFTNGRSLKFTSQKKIDAPLYLNKSGLGLASYLEEQYSDSFDEIDFGENYHSLALNYINATAAGMAMDFIANAQTINKLRELSYVTDKPDFLIASDDATNAIRYISGYDSAFIKSILVYNSSYATDLRLHLFDAPLFNGSNPTSRQITFPKVTSSDWVRLDVEDLFYSRNAGESFDIGLQYMGSGSMGYIEPAGTTHINKSFLKPAGRQDFQPLNLFSTSQGALNGSWMIRLEIATRLTEAEIRKNEGLLDIYSIAPNPFLPSKNSRIEFYYLTRGAPQLNYTIFNILGQAVYSASSLSSGVISWDGKTPNGQLAASGMYIISISSKNQTKHKKFIIVR